MAWPQDVLGNKVEIYYDGAWHNIITDTPLGADEPNSRVRGLGAADGEISIQARGLGDQDTSISPTVATLSVNNKDGKYSPRNAMSILYGKIGPNTPLRIATDLSSTVDVVDSFSVNGASGWPTSPSGHVWTVTGGSAADYSVTGGEAIQSHAASNVRHTSALNALLITDFDAYVRGMRVEALPTGGNVEAGVRGRYVDVNNHVEGRVSFTTANTVTANIRSITAGVETTSAFVVVVGGLTTETFDMRFQAEGRTLRMKVWESAVVEPSTWTVTLAASHLVPGIMSVTSFCDVANSNAKPYDFFYTSVLFSLGIILASLEVAEWPKKWDGTGSDVWVQLNASGITERLRQGDAVMRSPLYRAMVRTNVVAYWDFENLEGVFTRSTYASIPSALDPTMKLLTANAAFNDVRVQWDGEPNLLGSDVLPLAEAASNSVSSLFYRNTTLFGTAVTDTAFSLCFWHRVPLQDDSASISSSVALDIKISNSASVASVLAVCRMESTAGSVKQVALSFYALNSAGGVVVSIVDFLVEYLDSWRFLRFTVDQNAGNYRVRIYIDEVLATTATVGATTTGQPTFITEASLNFATSVVTPDLQGAWGHLAVATGTTVDDIATRAATIYTAGFRAHTGESSVTRMTRIFAEESVYLEVVSTGDELDTLGPQKNMNFIALAEETVRSSDGLLFELRSTFGYRFMTLQALYEPTTRLTIDYTAFELGEVPNTTDDNQRTINRVTAKRVNGGSYIAERTSGPLSTRAPTADPPGVGVYPGDIEINVEDDDQLVAAAQFRLFLSTWDESRWPGIVVYLHRTPFTGNRAQLTAAAFLDIGEIFSLVNRPNWTGYGDVLHQMRSVSVQLSNFTWGLQWSSIPGGPYASLGSVSRTHQTVDESRLDVVHARTVSTVDSDDTDIIVYTYLTETPYDTPLWTRDLGQYDMRDAPGIDFRINPASRVEGLGGEQVTAGRVSDISDTFTRSGAQLAGTNTDTGQTWAQVAGTATAMALSGTSVVVTHTAASTDHWAAFPVGATSQDYDVCLAVDVAFSVASASGGQLISDIMVREVDGNNNYFVRLIINPGTAQLIVQHRKVVAGAGSQWGQNLFLVPNLFVGAVWRVKACIVGRTFMSKVWLTPSLDEPDWQFIALDWADDVVNGRDVGIRSIRLVGNTNNNCTTTYDNLEVWKPRIEPYRWDYYRRTALNDPTATFPDDGGSTSYSWFGTGAPAPTAIDFDFTPNQLAINVPAASGNGAVYLTDINLLDCVVSVVWTAQTATGADLQPGSIMTRMVGINPADYVVFRPAVTTTGTVNLAILQAGSVIGSTTVSGLLHAGSGTPLKTKVACHGTQLMMKIWNPDLPEPPYWHLVVTDPNPRTGWIGIRGARAAANTNTVAPQFTFHAFEVENPQRITVERSVNGVARGWDAGSDFRLWSPIRLGR